VTALGTSRVWVTLGYGILNEVYWPATGLPQIRDLGFIVAGPSEWFEACPCRMIGSRYRRSRTKATATGCSSKCFPILAET
jgi:GH15 family glucan-1,4-alpha-glucosidase